MKKVLSLILMLLLLAGCAPRPAQTEFVPTTDVPATAEPSEAPIDDSRDGRAHGRAHCRRYARAHRDPQAHGRGHRKPRSAGEGL